MLRLALRFEDQVRHFPVPAGDVRLGAAAENDLVAPFPGISRRHAALRPQGGGVLVTDLGSRNGLVRDGRRLGEVLLAPGEAVRLGRAVLALERVSSSDAETGLRLQTAGRGTSVPAAETASMPPPAAASPAAALRFVRERERAGDREPAEWLGDARRALGARTLLVLRGDALEACDGPFPADGELEEGGALRAGPLAAFFDAPPEPWQRDFFDYLAETVPPGPEPAEAAASDPDPLRLPAGFVAGSSAAMRDLLAQVRATARSDLNVLLVGETGTGKELFARMVHASGPRASGRFVAINCAAIPAGLLEAELFGVAGRVATDVDPRPGLLVQAHGGTIFLDEIGDMPEPLQAKLLRVLQEREVLPLGAAAPRKIDARVVAASNRDLGTLVRAGAFRADLYYRLRGLELRLPPLRERRDDLPELILAFAARAAKRHGKRIRGVSRRALAALRAHDWPGNVRELEAAIERAVLLCPNGGALQHEHLGLEAPPAEAASAEPPPEPPAPAVTLQDQVELLERRAILDALAATKGNRTQAARMLGITRNGLALKMQRLGL